MKRLAYGFIAVLLTSHVAYAGGKKDFAKNLDETFDKVQSAYFNAGFYAGAACGITAVTNARQKASEGANVSGDEMMAELEKCEDEAKKKYKVK